MQRLIVQYRFLSSIFPALLEILSYPWTIINRGVLSTKVLVLVASTLWTAHSYSQVSNSVMQRHMIQDDPLQKKFFKPFCSTNDAKVETVFCGTLRFFVILRGIWSIIDEKTYCHVAYMCPPLHVRHIYPNIICSIKNMFTAVICTCIVYGQQHNKMIINEG